MTPLEAAKEMGQEADIQNSIKGSRYGARVLESLLAHSVAQNYTEAVKEWEWVKEYVDEDRTHNCELCGHEQLKNVCILRNNKQIGNPELRVGSKCVEQFAWLEIPNGDTKKAYVSRRIRAMKKKLAMEKWFDANPGYKVKFARLKKFGKGKKSIRRDRQTDRYEFCEATSTGYFWLGDDCFDAKRVGKSELELATDSEATVKEYLRRVDKAIGALDEAEKGGD